MRTTDSESIDTETTDSELHKFAANPMGSELDGRNAAATAESISVARVFERLGRWLLLPIVALFGAASADYTDEWGPTRNAPLPMLEAFDQDGVLRSVDNLTGSQGLLLFLNRSADW